MRRYHTPESPEVIGRANRMSSIAVSATEPQQQPAGSVAWLATVGCDRSQQRTRGQNSLHIGNDILTLAINLLMRLRIG